MLDTVAYKKKEIQRKQNTAIDYELMFTLISIIKSIDGRVYDEIKLEDWVKKLPMRDVNFLLTKSAELTGKVGLDTEIVTTCSKCGYEVVSSFRYTSEFFRPTY